MENESDFLLPSFWSFLSWSLQPQTHVDSCFQPCVEVPQAHQGATLGKSPLYKGRIFEFLPWCDSLSAACSMAKLWGREMEKGVILILNESKKSESGNGLNLVNWEHPWHARRWRRMESKAIGFFISPNSILQLSNRIPAFSYRNSIISSTSRLNSMALLSVSDLLLFDCPPWTAQAVKKAICN